MTLSALEVTELMTYVFSILSCIGCAAMINFYIFFPAERADMHIFCLWLGVSGIGVASTSFIVVDEVQDGDLLCTLFPIIEDYFLLCSSFIIVIIAVRVQMIVFQQPGHGNIPKDELRKYFALAWGLPTVFVALPLITDSYGKNDEDYYCFVKYDHKNNERKNNLGKMMAYLSFYAPVLVSVVIIIVIYSRCIHQINSLKRNDPGMSSKLDNMSKKIRLYPVIFVFVISVPLVHRLSTTVGLSSHPWINTLAYSFWKLQGFLDSMAYGWSTNMYKVYTDQIIKNTRWAADCCRKRDSKKKSVEVLASVELMKESSLFTLRQSDDQRSAFDYNYNEES